MNININLKLIFILLVWIGGIYNVYAIIDEYYKRKKNREEFDLERLIGSFGGVLLALIVLLFHYNVIAFTISV